MADQTTDLRLSSNEMLRYQRHFSLENVGLDGQQTLKAASVLIVGAGGLGSPLAIYLAAAGVGRLGIVDFDVVDASNLHRQVLHGSSDIGRKKVSSALDTLREINPFVCLETHAVRLTRDNAVQLVKDYDVVADGSDNFPTRYLVNDACILAERPNVYASVYKFEGQVAVFAHPEGPCYRCVFPEPPPGDLVPSCAEGGVLGVLPGILGSLQANEVIKLLLRIGDPLVGRMLLFDGLTSEFRVLHVPRDSTCRACGEATNDLSLPEFSYTCGTTAMTVPEITVSDLHAMRLNGQSPFVLDVRKPFEQQIASIDADQLIPVEALAERLGELDAPPGEMLVVHCRSGGRSARAVQLLRASGYNHAVNLKGGILAWSQEIDPAVPMY